jgi:hypothetical protein
METLDYPSWRWGLSLIALTMAIHAAAVVTMGIAAVKIRLRLETRGFVLWHLILIMICIVAVIGLLLAVALVIECGIWAAAYLWLGALDSPLDALLFSIDSMSTRGASGLTLERHWQLMGALESVNGMLLFGVSTAWLFTVAQGHWFMIAEQVAPKKS